MSAAHLTYRGYRIDFDPPPIPDRRFDWSATHEDYDGPEDNRHVRAATVKDLYVEIDCIEDEARAERDEAADRAAMVNVGGHRDGGSAS